MESRGGVRRYLLKYRARLLLGLLFVICSNALGLLAPAVLQRAIDHITAGAEAAAGAALDPLDLAPYAGLIVLLAVGDGLARFCSRLLLNRVSRQVEYELRDDLFA